MSAEANSLEQALLVCFDLGIPLSWVSRNLFIPLPVIKRTVRNAQAKREAGGQIPEYLLAQNKFVGKLLQRILNRHATIGLRGLYRQVRKMRLHIPKKKICELYRKVCKPAGVTLPVRLGAEVGGIRGPLSLLRIELIKSLARWKISVHFAVDVYSKLVTLVDASASGSSIFHQFLRSTVDWGVPSRVSFGCDFEDLSVMEYIVTKRGPERSSCIRDIPFEGLGLKSLRKRIQTESVKMFIDIFRNMEKIGILSLKSETDLVALHVVFLPLLRKSLDHFLSSWNKRPLQRRPACSPLELFHEGLNTLAAQEGEKDGVIAELFQPLSWQLEALEKIGRNSPVYPDSQNHISQRTPRNLLQDAPYRSALDLLCHNRVNIGNAAEYFLIIKSLLRSA